MINKIKTLELYERIVKENKIDQAIEEAERELREGVKPLSAKEAKKRLDKKLLMK